MKKICFFGSREAEHTQELEDKLVDVLEKFIRQGTVDFYAGGERGFELISECVVLMLHSDYPQIRLHLVYPCPGIRQTEGWELWDYILYRYAAECAKTIEVCSGFEERDRKILEYADCCVCYDPDDTILHMARERGIEIVNLNEI